LGLIDPPDQQAAIAFRAWGELAMAQTTKRKERAD
jgi:hypothetical protein